MKKHTFFLVAFLFLVSCKNTKKGEVIVNDGTSNNEVGRTGENHPGKQILETECYICHDPKTSMKSSIAPPMAAIKQHYILQHTSKEEFTEALIAWVNDPETETKMPEAQRKFGKMPYIPYPDDALAQIAEYLYVYEVEKPKWFDAKYGQIKTDTSEFQNQIGKHAKIGMQYAKAAKQSLGMNLLKAIQEKGPEGAVKFCNVKAVPLTDSVSVMNNAAIRRVSDKPRNLDNRANDEERGYIDYFKKLIAADVKPKPIVKMEGREVHFYFPITTNTMCLQCHGTPEKQIHPETLSTLQKLYPKDKAIGYGEKEVRGLWAIAFDADF